MYIGNKAKFEQNKQLANKLLPTTGSVSFYASSSFWCKWNSKIIQLIRAELRNDTSLGDDVVIKEIWSQIEQYEALMMKKYPTAITNDTIAITNSNNNNTSNNTDANSNNSDNSNNDDNNNDNDNSDNNNNDNNNNSNNS